MSKTNKYFYSKEEDEALVKKIQNDFKRRQKERLPYELRWELNLHYYLGNQHTYVTDYQKIGMLEKQYLWQNQEVFNHIAPIIETRIAKLNKLKPEIFVNTASSSDEDIFTSKLTKTIITETLNNNNFDEILSNATLWSEITGTSFYKVSWNNNLGYIIGEDERQTYKSGDVKISICSPFNIYPDSSSTLEIEDCESIIEAHAVPISYIKENFDQDVSGEDIELCDLDTLSFISNLSGRTNNTKLTHTIKHNHTYLIERYEKPNRNHINGRLTIICQNKLLYDGDLPYIINQYGERGYPFIKQVSTKTLNSFWGISVIERCIPIQKAYNAIKNRKHDFISRLTSGVLAVEDGSIDTDNLEYEGISPGKIIIYRNGAQAPKFLQSDNIPVELEKEEEKLLQELNNMCCVSDFSTNSSVPGNINSGSALNLIIKQDESRLSMVAEYINQAIKKLGKFILLTFKQFAINTRVSKIKNNNGCYELLYWSTNNINFDNINVDTVINNSQQEEQIKNTIISLYEKGLFFDEDGNITRKNKNKILSLLGLSNWDDNNLDKIHQEKAINENMKEILLNNPLEIDDHAIHIEEHKKFILLNSNQNLDEEFLNKLLEHIKLHQKYLLN